MLRFYKFVLNLLARLNRKVYCLPLSFWRLVYPVNKRLDSAWRIQTVLPDYLGQLKMHIDTFPLVEWSIWATGYYEFEIIQLLKRLLKKGDRVVDVGANVGDNTLPASLWVGPTGAVLAVEPNPAMHSRLAQNVQLNALKNVMIEKSVLSDKEGKVDFYLAAEDNFNQGSSSLYPSHTRSSSRLRLEALRLDGLLKRFGWDKLNLLLIDTEGHDLAVLQGGLEAITRHKPVILFEAFLFRQRNLEQQLRQLFLRFDKLGYHCYLIPSRIPFWEKTSWRLFRRNIFSYLKPLTIDEASAIDCGNLLLTPVDLQV